MEIGYAVALKKENILTCLPKDPGVFCLSHAGHIKIIDLSSLELYLREITSKTCKKINLALIFRFNFYLKNSSKQSLFIYFDF